MKTLRHRRLMRVLMAQCNGSYARAAMWIQVSKTYGDGSYNKPTPVCDKCGK